MSKPADERLINSKPGVKAAKGQIILFRVRDALVSVGHTLRVGVVSREQGKRTYYRDGSTGMEDWTESEHVLAIIPSVEAAQQVSREITLHSTAHRRAMNDLNNQTLDRWDELAASVIANQGTP